MLLHATWGIVINITQLGCAVVIIIYSLIQKDNYALDESLIAIKIESQPIPKVLVWHLLYASNITTLINIYTDQHATAVCFSQPLLVPEPIKFTYFIYKGDMQ